MRTTICGGLVLALVSSSASAYEPRPINSAGQVKKELGAVRISVQSQVQLLETLHVFFLREGGDPRNSADILKFERKQGVPILGANMVDTKPQVFAVPAGRYRLLAHTVGCGTLPPMNTVCAINWKPMPTARYGEDAPVFEVRTGSLTEAGEFILEAPLSLSIGEGTAVKAAMKDPESFVLKVRQRSGPRPTAFASLPAGPALIAAPDYISSIRCVQRPKGAMMYLPFDC